MITACPLAWPDGWARTKSHLRKNGKFKSDGRWITVFAAVDRVLDELNRLGITRDDIVISTNLKTRMDGLPRSDQAAPGDCGVAVYWEDKSHMRRVMAIDHYDTVADNLAAIAATLEAMRAIERHGGARILERAFTGFTAIAAPAPRHWREVIGVPDWETKLSEVRFAYRRRAMEVHPDRPGGSHTAMTELNAALAQAEKELPGVKKD